PICGGPPPVHPAIRPASDCTHQFCKKCCQRFQRDGASACMMPSHRIVPTSASAQPASQSHSAPDPTLPSSTIDGAIATASGIRLINGSQDFSRPLRLEHYERRANAEIEQQTTVNRATEIKEAETLAKSTVAILYWKELNEARTSIQIACTTFPHFTLARCTPAVKGILGVLDDPDMLLETFDPEQGAWVLQDSSVSRTLSVGYPKLLYRLPRGSSWADSTVKTEDGMSNPAAAAVASSSGHGKWPLKYVQSMSEGFRKMSTMKGTLHHRFGSSFNTAFPGSNATYHDNEDIWNNAPKHLKDKYIRAGFTDAGLWKDFRKEVKAGFPDGRAPRKRSKNGAHAKKEATDDVGNGTYIKEEDAELVIELSD
ncbi:hypothetical protein BJ912DRAFT_852357, partial [Pholiota molesta]